VIAAYLHNVSDNKKQLLSGINRDALVLQGVCETSTISGTNIRKEIGLYSYHLLLSIVITLHSIYIELHTQSDFGCYIHVMAEKKNNWI